MLGTLDFTGSEHWAPFNYFPWSTALALDIQVWVHESWESRGSQETEAYCIFELKQANSKTLFG